MTNRFQDRIFEAYSFEQVPLDHDLFMVDEKYIDEWESCVRERNANGAENIPVYFVSAKKIYPDSIELRWFINIFTRFHAVPIHLPRDKFVDCAGAIMWDEKVHLFVKSEWLSQLIPRLYAVFGLVDAVGAKEALRSGALDRPRLESLRVGIDRIALKYPSIAFISFGDSVLLKGNWSAEYVRKEHPQTYRPEEMIEVYEAIAALYRAELDLPAYGIFTQGSNEFYADDLLHTKGPANHVGLNSVGAPFAQLIEIETAVKRAVKAKNHPPSDLYFDHHFFASLNFKSYQDKDKIPAAPYESKVLESGGRYHYADAKILMPMLKHLDETPSPTIA